MRPPAWGIALESAHLLTAGLWAGGIIALSFLRPPGGWKGASAKELLDLCFTLLDRARIGVWGTDAAGGHSLTAAAVDARVKAAVAQVPIIAGKDLPRRASRPDPERQAQMVKLARTGQAPAYPESAEVMNALEARVAEAEYHPFWYVDQVPQTTAVLFIIAESCM